MITEEQREQRRHGLGGSDIAIIMGVNRWGSEIDLQAEKLGIATEPEPENEAMWWGTQMEDLVAKRYEEVTGRVTRRYNATLRKGWLIGHLDRLVVPEGAKIAAHGTEIRTDRLLECKTSGDFDWADGVPLYYQVQVQHYMNLTGCKYADIAVFHKPSNKFDVHTIERDDEVIAVMEKIANDWWERHIVRREACRPRTNEDCKKLWERSVGTTVDAPQDILDSIAKLKEVKATIAELEAKEEELTVAVKSVMQDADSLLDHGKVVATWKTIKGRTTTDWKGVATELKADASIVERFTKTSAGARVFKLK